MLRLWVAGRMASVLSLLTVTEAWAWLGKPAQGVASGSLSWLRGVLLIVGVLVLFVVMRGMMAARDGQDPWNERKSLRAGLKSIFGSKDYWV